MSNFTFALLFRLSAFSFPLFILATLGCDGAKLGPPDGRLLVAVSIIPQAWLVRAVGGPRVDVVTLVTPGESHHTYQPTDAQVSRVMASAVFFRIGTSFENAPWFHALEAAGKPRVVDLRDGVSLLDMAAHHDDDEEGPPDPPRKGTVPFSLTRKLGQSPADRFAGKDPHIWLSPRRLKIQAATIAQTLAEQDPAHRGEYERNLAAVQQRLDELERTLAARLAPLKGKAFFVFHPAWGYFADDYGLRQISVEVEGKEPSDQELTQLQRQARQSGVKVVFVQPQFGGRSARAVADAAGARLETADPLPADLPAGLLQLADALVASYQ
jgi:zinc transport system substrate-binding protein